MARRKPGTLIPLEAAILRTALSMRRGGEPVFHGFGLARAMRDGNDARPLTAHGTLYKALGRLEEVGLLASHWEESTAERRPRRRLYELTGAGVRAAERERAAAAGTPSLLRPKPQHS